MCLCRVFIFSLALKGKPVPIFSPLTAFTFTSINGFIQGRYLVEYMAYDEWWFIDPRFLLGHVVFLLGMAANIHADAILRGLRKPGETGYKIPEGERINFILLLITKCRCLYLLLCAESLFVGYYG